MTGASGTKTVGFLQGGSDWISGSVTVNPTDGAVLVDTGPLNAGNYLFATVIVSTVDSAADMQYRDATNATSIDSQRRLIAAGTNDDFLFPNKLTFAVNERLRVVQNGNVTGTVQSSIYWLEVG